MPFSMTVREEKKSTGEFIPATKCFSLEATHSHNSLTRNNCTVIPRAKITKWILSETWKERRNTYVWVLDISTIAVKGQIKIIHLCFSFFKCYIFSHIMELLYWRQIFSKPIEWNLFPRSHKPLLCALQKCSSMSFTTNKKRFQFSEIKLSIQFPFNLSK